MNANEEEKRKLYERLNDMTFGTAPLDANEITRICDRLDVIDPLPDAYIDGVSADDVQAAFKRFKKRYGISSKQKGERRNDL